MKTRHQIEVIPFVVETCGGVGPAAVKLLKAMAKAGQEHLAMWPKMDIIRHVVGSVAMFVCLLLCIRLVGGFNGNKDKTLCWSAVSAASEGVWDVIACAQSCY